MHSKQELTLNELMVLSSEMRQVEKSTAIAYLMLLGGHLGLHRFYLKKNNSGLLQLLLFIAAILFYFLAIVSSSQEAEPFFILCMVMFVLSAIGLTIWIIIDLFLLPHMLHEFNSHVEQEIIQAILHHRHMEQLMGRSKPEQHF
ncbi:NINE protein [Paenibacillus sp. GCM10027626]|uniref:NINE protein n=1 Tax=Paenibacillus sp. GCM10027626 TaxID=3273411 RepID=UPI00362A2AFA